jgi:PleD family two-component response regulator
MTARVLVVDDLLPNLKLLEARLSAEYFEVLTATNGVDALDCANGDCDIVLLDEPSDRMRGLDAGADDFLSKPIDEIALLARVRSLSRLRLILDELRSRALRSSKLGIGDPFTSATADNGTGGRIMLVGILLHRERLAETPLYRPRTRTRSRQGARLLRRALAPRRHGALRSKQDGRNRVSVDHARD